MMKEIMKTMAVTWSSSSSSSMTHIQTTLNVCHNTNQKNCVLVGRQKKYWNAYKLSLFIVGFLVIWQFPTFNSLKKNIKRNTSLLSFLDENSLQTFNHNTYNNNNNKIRKDAIVIIITFATPCFIERMKHFMTTFNIPNNYNYNNNNNTMPIMQDNSTTLTSTAARIQYDVWIIHSHFLDPIQGNKSQTLIEQELPGVYTQQASSTMIAKFDSDRSKSAKSSFLNLVVQHGYDYAWHLENDLFYTGPWTQVINHPEILQDSTSDVITFHHQFQPAIAQNWYRYKPCQIHGKPCIEFTPIIKTMWYITRVSNRFATKTLQVLQQQNVKEIMTTENETETFGHHEAIVHPLCQYYGMKLTQLPKSIYQPGHLHAGSNKGEWANKSTQTLLKLANVNNESIVRHRLYHPVACQAYEETGGGGGGVGLDGINDITNNNNNNNQSITQVLQEWAWA